MGAFLKTLAEFIGRLLGALLPAAAREIRKNKTVKQTGADNETLDMLDNDVWNAARTTGVRKHAEPEDRTTS